MEGMLGSQVDSFATSICPFSFVSPCVTAPLISRHLKTSVRNSTVISRISRFLFVSTISTALNPNLGLVGEGERAPTLLGSLWISIVPHLDDSSSKLGFQRVKHNFFLSGRMNNRCRNSWEKKPQFFKVLVGNYKERMQIPLEFVKHISTDTSDMAILEGPSGSQWHVKLNRTTNEMYLQDGWEIFLKAHSLSFGEFLVFRYDGNMHFSVKIFGGNACEREDAFTVKCSQESTNCQGNEKHCNQSKVFDRKRKRGRPQKNSQEPNYHSQDLQNSWDCTLEQNNPHKSHWSDSLQGQRASLLKPDMIILTEEKAKEAAYSFSSTFPYFVREMKATVVGSPFRLTVPCHFSRAHLPSSSTEIALRNLEGKTWRVMFQISSTQQNLLCGGWKAFSFDNNLKEGDYCVFELVDELDMCVHIFPVGNQ